MLSKPIPLKSELAAALERAVAAYNVMTPQQKREMHETQRRSWVIGNMMLGNPDMSREYAEDIYDRAV